MITKIKELKALLNYNYTGIDEDFRAWRKIFWRKAGPILTGRKTLPKASVGTKDKCDEGGKCGGKCKSKEDGGKCSSEEEDNVEEEVRAVAQVC